jgi:tetratricopeptide (TPR) repeat protein
LSASLYWYPLSRLSIRADGALGIYQSAHLDNTYSNIFWRYGGELGYRFSPNLIISGHAGYRHYNYRPDDPSYAGIYAGITGQFLIQLGEKDTGLGVEVNQPEPLFPVFSGLYRQNQIGVLRITNNESAEIRNIRVSFDGGTYTSSVMNCGSVSRLGKRRVAEIPLYADFSKAILGFSENGWIPGEVQVEYELLGSRRSIVATAVVEVYNRNTFRWSDPTALSVFVSPSSPEVLDFSKYMVGIARNHLRTGLNRNMQFAMYLYEGLRASGISLGGDSSGSRTPYAEYRQDPAKLDTIQFPSQTLMYRSGDLDDLGLLFAASLEAAGIAGAIIPLADDFIVACSLEIDAASAEDFFSSLDNLIIIDDQVWMPLALSNFQDGFVNSWAAAAAKIRAAALAGERFDFIKLSQAWQVYPPAVPDAQAAVVNKAQEQNVFRVVEIDMLRYISSELGPKIQDAADAIASQGGSVALYNRLGLLYVRAGMYDDAEAVFQRSAALGSDAAMVNLGNLAVLEKNTDAAERWYVQALERNPQNRTAANGLNQIAVDRIE